MRSLRLLLTFVTSVSLVACGGGSSPTEPTSPAVAPAPSARDRRGDDHRAGLEQRDRRRLGQRPRLEPGHAGQHDQRRRHEPDDHRGPQRPLHAHRRAGRRGAAALHRSRHRRDAADRRGPHRRHGDADGRGERHGGDGPERLARAGRGGDADQRRGPQPHRVGRSVRVHHRRPAHPRRPGHGVLRAPQHVARPRLRGDEQHAHRGEGVAARWLLVRRAPAREPGRRGVDHADAPDADDAADDAAGHVGLDRRHAHRHWRDPPGAGADHRRHDGPHQRVDRGPAPRRYAGSVGAAASA